MTRVTRKGNAERLTSGRGLTVAKAIEPKGQGSLVQCPQPKPAPLVQLRYEGTGTVPTSAQIERWGRQWIQTGKSPRGVKITPVCWSKGIRNARTYLKRSEYAYFGCPGVVRCYARPNRSMFDFDCGQRKPNVQSALDLVIQTCNIRPQSVTWYRTRRGWHLVIEWNKALKPIVHVAIQAILGSDPRRETFNLSRVLSGMARNPRWNLLFEYKLR